MERPRLTTGSNPPRSCSLLQHHRRGDSGRSREVFGATGIDRTVPVHEVLG